MKAISSVGANQTVNAAKVVSAGSQMLAAMSDKMSVAEGALEGEGSELAKVQQDGLRLLGSSGGDPVAAMKENPKFVEEIKRLVVTYVQDAVMDSIDAEVKNMFNETAPGGFGFPFAGGAVGAGSGSG